MGDQQHAEAHRRMEERRPDGDPGQHLERKDHALHVRRVRHHEERRPQHALGEETVDHEAREEDERELARMLERQAPARLEDDAEDERVQAEQHERLEHRPEEAERRATIAPEHLALGELPDERAMAPEAGEDLERTTRRS